MERQLYMALYKRKQLLEAQISAYHLSLNTLEDSRLSIRTCLSADSVPRFWTNSREILNRHIRAHMAVVAEYCWVLNRLEKFNKIYSNDRNVDSDPAAPV